MKIGEAGEAFFVFETDEDVPESLVTSPILEATQPGETNAQTRDTGRFGAGEPSPEAKDVPESNQEPEFLDLDASAEAPPSSDPSPTSAPAQAAKSEEVPEETSKGPSLLSRTAELGKAIVGVAHEVTRNETDKLKDKTVLEALKETEKSQSEFVRDKAAATFNVTQHAAVAFPSTEEKGDEVLPEGEMEKAHEPEVRYTDSE